MVPVRFVPSFTAQYAGAPVKSTLVSLTMPLSAYLGITDQPGRLDGYGPVTAALARRIAQDAARDQPQFTSWRCIVVDDVHGTVLGATDPIRTPLWTPRHDPPPRLSRLVTGMEPVCVFPGCRLPARRCDLDHRIPYDHQDPGRAGGQGRTCSCNLQPMCRSHHQQKTAGALRVRAVSRNEDPTVPAGTLEWTLPSGVTCRTHPFVAQTAPIPASGPDHDGRDADSADGPDSPDSADGADGDGADDVLDSDWADRAWRHSLARAAQARADVQARAADAAHVPGHIARLDDPPF